VATPAIPEKPRAAAMSATMRKVIAQPNMGFLLFGYSIPETWRRGLCRR
jgi:hypothetical protein